MLSNAYFEYYFLAKFRFDTAENERAKNLQNVAKNARSPIDRASLSTGRGTSSANALEEEGRQRRPRAARRCQRRTRCQRGGAWVANQDRG